MADPYLVGNGITCPDCQGRGCDPCRGTGRVPLDPAAIVARTLAEKEKAP